MRLVRYYSDALYKHPTLFVVVPVILTGLIPLISLYFKPVKLTPNAEVGFDTKDTDYSGPRLAWKELQQYLSHTNRIPFANPRPLNATSARRFLEDQPQRRHRRGWADDLLHAVQNVPCYDAPIPLMNHLSQMVIELPSFGAIFDLNVLKKMCGLQKGIAKELSGFENYTPYRNIWHIGNYFACLSPNVLVNCSELTKADVELVKTTVLYCADFRKRLIDCKLKCEEQCSECKDVPKNCSNQMMFDLFYRILPSDLTSRPFLLNSFLPLFTLTGYSTQNIPIPIPLYEELENAIVRYADREGIKLKGLLMDTKRERLLPAAMRDSVLAVGAAVLIMIVIALHSRSIVYAITVFIVLGLSVTGALGIYAWFTSDFPLLNLVIFVLLIAVGTDDAFLLFSSFPSKINDETFYHCLSHTSATMFLTSFSTAVPFFVNILSNVIVFRCFGLFAGLTVVINWFLVVSFLPAALLIQKRYCSCLPSLPSLGNICSFSVREVLPDVILQGRFVWLSCLSVIVVASGFVSYRDLRLPEYNPLQLFTGANLHEWYDNNAEKNFEFVAAKIAMPLYARLVWGVQPIESTARFRADAITPLKSDNYFFLDSVPAVKDLAKSLKTARNLDFIRHKEKFWPERFLTWSDHFICAEGFICCNISHNLFTNSYLDFCLRNSTSFIPTSYNDTPIFDNTTFALTGYTAMLPTQLKYNHRFSLLSKAFDLLATVTPSGGFWVPEWPLMSTWFDLQRSIISDCKSSVFISLAVVAIFALAQLKVQAFAAVLTCSCIILTSVGIVVLYGWVIGVLEAVILVLVVGLSFDYTLHYGAALPDEGCPEHRVRKAASIALPPVSLAAFTSFLAGASMLFAKTHAFFQVGMFLVVVTSVSWLFATFFFLPLLTVTLCSSKSKSCQLCDALSTYPMDRKR